MPMRSMNIRTRLLLTAVILSAAVPAHAQSQSPDLGDISIEELMNLVTLWGPKTIVPDSVGGLAQLTNIGVGDLTQTNVPGVFTELTTGRLEPTGQEGLYTLV